MLRLFAAILLMSGTLWAADETDSVKLAAPEGWSGETIALPPRVCSRYEAQGF